MSATHANHRHLDQPLWSPRRHYPEEDRYPRLSSGRTNRSTPHRRHSSSSMRPHSGRSGSVTRKTLLRTSGERLRPSREDYTSADGVPPLRRQSTQPPRHRTSPASQNRDQEREVVYNHRGVHRTSPRRVTPMRHALGAYPSVDDSKQKSPHRSARRSRHQHEPPHSDHDSLLRSHDRSNRHSSARSRSLRRSTRSPTRREHRTPSLQKPRHESTEPHMHSSRKSARRHRHLDPATPIVLEPVTEPTPHRSYLHLFDKEGDRDEKEAPNTRRRTSARRSLSQRQDSRHHSERRHRQHHRNATPASVDEKNRTSRHTPLARPIEESHLVSPHGTGSTYVRLAANHSTTGRPRSGSCIEIISVHSRGENSTNGWSQSRSSVAHSPRRLQDIGPPVAIASPQRQQIIERIDSTRLWLNKMKQEVKKKNDIQRIEHLASDRAARQSARGEHRRSTPHADRGERDRTSSTGTRSRPRVEADTVSRLASGSDQVTEYHKRRDRIPPKTSSGGSVCSVEQPLSSKQEKSHRSRSRPSSATPRSARGEENSLRSAKAPPAPISAPLTPTRDQHVPAEVTETNGGSHQKASHHPNLFVSFLDGKKFDSTASLSQYNIALAESLSDEHLDRLRSAVFDKNEDAFAELLYGDDVEEEIEAAAATLSHHEDPAVQRELAALQKTAVHRFNKKCARALKKLSAAGGGLAEALQVAASQMER